jgi:beta-galactosidase
LETAGPYAYATEITEKSALIGLEVPARNERTTAAEAELHAEILDATGHSVMKLSEKKSVAAGASVEFKFSAKLANPKLWEPAYPHVYRVVSSLRIAGETIDTCEIPLGIRHVRWEAASGFYINGQHVKLHGWGQKPTNEWAGLGAALPDWLHFYTLELMRAGGGNFVRWGHAAAGPAQISAGDRLGIVALQPGADGEHDTIGGAWQLRASVFRDAIIYFRNNPSILLWEGGNQKITRAHAKELRGYMDKYDPHGGRAYTHRRADAITAEFMDVGVGTEGGREIARLPVVEGEYNREESPRRVWDNFSPPNFGYPEAKGQTYQLNSEQFAVNEVSHYVKKLGADNHAGGGNWIFSDSTSGGRVAVEVARNSGEVDAVRLPKPAFDVMTAMWREEPQVRIIGHWTYPAGTKKVIYVASNASEVELYLNGQSLGLGKRSDRYLFTFSEITFVPGELKAVAKNNGVVVASDSKRTAGTPVALRLTVITAPGGLRADGSDIALIDIEAVDAQGQRCPTVQPRVDFTFSGPGTWRGGYNSGKLDSTNNLFLDLEAGINRVAVRASRNPGKLFITAASTGLSSASVEITANAFTGAAPIAGHVNLPNQAPTRSISPTATATVKASGPIMLGKFIKTLNYTAPNAAIVHVEVDARPGKNAYVNAETPFPALPAELLGSDWVQADDRDSTYSAVDLMEIAVNSGSTVTIAHDDRLPRPAWLTKQFKPTGAKIIVLGQSLSLFAQTTIKEASFTLGANTEDTRIKEAGMYIVFVNGGSLK